MSTVSVNVVLTGGNRGKSGVFGKYKFLNGVCRLTGDPVNLQYALTYLARAYQAYPEGSEELEQARALYESEDSKDGTTSNNEEATGQRGSESVHGENGTSGEQTQELRDNDSEQSTGSSESGAVDRGSSRRDGSQSSEPDSVAKAENPKLMTALRQLDPNNEDLWRTDGKPRMEAVEKLYGAADLNRDMIEKCWPRFDRDKARKYHAENDDSSDESAADIV